MGAIKRYENNITIGVTGPTTINEIRDTDLTGFYGAMYEEEPKFPDREPHEESNADRSLTSKLIFDIVKFLGIVMCCYYYLFKCIPDGWKYYIKYGFFEFLTPDGYRTNPTLTVWISHFSIIILGGYIVFNFIIGHYESFFESHVDPKLKTLYNWLNRRNHE